MTLVVYPRLMVVVVVVVVFSLSGPSGRDWVHRGERRRKL